MRALLSEYVAAVFPLSSSITEADFLRLGWSGEGGARDRTGGIAGERDNSECSEKMVCVVPVVMRDELRCDIQSLLMDLNHLRSENTQKETH